MANVASRAAVPPPSAARGTQPAVSERRRAACSSGQGGSFDAHATGSDGAQRGGQFVRHQQKNHPRYRLLQRLEQRSSVPAGVIFSTGSISTTRSARCRRHAGPPRGSRRAHGPRRSACRHRANRASTSGSLPSSTLAAAPRRRRRAFVFRTYKTGRWPAAWQRSVCQAPARPSADMHAPFARWRNWCTAVYASAQAP